MLANVDRAFMMHEPVEDMRGLAGVRGDDLGIERRVAVGDVGVELHARFRAVFGVVVSPGLAMSAGAKELMRASVLFREIHDDPQGSTMTRLSVGFRENSR